jgi:hypothetical protein
MTRRRTARQFATVIVLVLAFNMSAYADEPNEDFNSATVLAPGVLSVLDTLSSNGGGNPDTVLGSRGHFGGIDIVDDESSPIGDGHASALYGVPTNSGSINFAVSGYDDFGFLGDHFESGNYEVFVDVYDFFDDLIDSFSSGSQTLVSGNVDEYSYSDSAWIGATYDVYIDNDLGSATDVDFFTFTGLTPGTPFAALTSDPDQLGIDTLLGWFSNLGELIEVDDDDAGGVLSLIDGIVPENGELTFAVTGFGDDGFIGQHSEIGAYGLELELNPGSPIGDYNGDGKVSAADYTVWRDTLGSTTDLRANGDDSNSVIDLDDYQVWLDSFGQSEGNGASLEVSISVPEPRTIALLLMLGAVCQAFRRGQRGRESCLDTKKDKGAFWFSSK